MNIGVYGFTEKRTQEQWSPDGPKDNHTALCSRIETQPSPLALAASFKREKKKTLVTKQKQIQLLNVYTQ